MKVPEIAWLLAAKEGENIEFKKAENTFEFDELAKYACAIANRGGGYVVLGITDKRPRQIVGIREKIHEWHSELLLWQYYHASCVQVAMG